MGKTLLELFSGNIQTKPQQKTSAPTLQVRKPKKGTWQLRPWGLGFVVDCLIVGLVGSIFFGMFGFF